MGKIYLAFTFLLLIFSTVPGFIFSQAINTDTLPQFKTIEAGPEYKAKGLYKWFWGSNYRNIWTAPVTVPVLNMHSMYGGLTVFKADTNAVIKTLYLKNAENKLYVLMAVNRMPGRLLPPMFHNTYAEDRLNDEVSITNPYSSATMPGLTSAANIFSTDVNYFFVPKQTGLSVFSNGYGDDFYKLLVLPENLNLVAVEDSSNTIETSRLIEILKYNSYNNSIDKNAFIRERLFDMFVNDWYRGEGKWKWLGKKNGDKIMYVPLPEDRAAAYSKYNGKFTKLAFGLNNINLIESFKSNLKSVSRFNFKEKNIDRVLLNEATLNDWQNAAMQLQQSLTDTVIKDAVWHLPKEVYPLTGDEIISKLKARRSHLVEWATEYYTFLSKEVEVAGSYQHEEFNVQQTNNKTTVRVFSINNNQQRGDTAIYTRTFTFPETKEIRLFGLGAYDKYNINGSDNLIKIKIIDGSDNDSINVFPVNKTNNVTIYGDKHNVQSNDQAPLKFISDTSFKSYRYNWYNYDKKGFAPMIFYSNEDRLFVALNYRIRHYAWGKAPFASNQVFSLHYSLLEKAFSAGYRAVFPNLVLKSTLALFTNYDDVRWTYFFGLGNDAKFNLDKGIKYYTMRTRQWVVQPALVRAFGRSTITVFANFNGVKIINDTARFLNKEYDPNKKLYNWNNFAGGGISYSYQKLNDAIVPTRGVFFNAAASGAQNLATGSGYYFKYEGAAHFYVPLVSKFSLNIRAGASTVTGNPEFYQYASLGGVIFRGTVRDRFWGKTAFYNTNDLRFISPVHTKLFVGKAGFLAFVDNGRVWMPGENSNTWHVAYGGGIILAPFNFAYADFNYGRMKKESSIQVRVTFFIP